MSAKIIHTYTKEIQMRIGIPKESFLGERRVAASPSSVSTLIKLGFTVQVQKSAGTKASFTDQELSLIHI